MYIVYNKIVSIHKIKWGIVIFLLFYLIIYVVIENYYCLEKNIYVAQKIMQFLSKCSKRNSHTCTKVMESK